MAKIYSVSQLNRYIKQRLDSDVILSDIMLRGEISNFKLHSSGHCYFSLKDASSAVRCVAFRSNAACFRFVPQNGMKVTAGGYISVYERDGAYQFYVQRLMPEGAGEMALALEQIKQKLSAEGLFDAAHKKELPFMPKKIGVVTSRTGAVIRDICHVAARRNPHVQIVLYSVLVQGEHAADEIAAGIDFFNKRYPVDVIIAGRGGGSMEDLWAFNEEKTVRAVYNSAIPIISAVGHETDFTLSDLAADVRATTPSQAAELAVPELSALLGYVESVTLELQEKARRIIMLKRSRLEMLQQSSVLSHGDRLLAMRRQRLDALAERLEKAMRRCLDEKIHRARLLTEKLSVLNPAGVLKRGYGMVKKKNKLVKNTAELKINDTIEVVLNDGSVSAKVLEIKGPEPHDGDGRQ